MTASDLPAPEFSRPIFVAKLPGAGASYKIAATEAERAALARRFGLVSLDRLEADVRLHRAAGDICLAAELSAELVQSCVATLEPVPSTVTQRFTLRYRPGLDEDEADLLALEDPEEEIVEPLMGEAIDIGEAVAQELSVVMDPYPRAPGAPTADSGAVAAAEGGGGSGAKGGRANPFEVLAALKRQS
jgi:uncharacterized metal-binding protein YceD (DUF177 family)